MLDRIYHFYNKESDHGQLVIYRSILYFVLFVHCLYNIRSINVYDCNQWQPLGIFKILFFTCHHHTPIYAAYGTLITSFLAFAGVFTRINSILCPIFASYYFLYSANFQPKFSHSSLLFLMALFILAFGPALSLRSRSKENKTVSTWSLQLIKQYTAFTYFICGFQKLLKSGLAWIFSNNLFSIAFDPSNDGVLNQAFLNAPHYFHVASAFYVVIICELLSPLALINKTFGKIYFFLWFSIHVGIFFVLGDHLNFFLNTVTASVFILPWLSLVIKKPQTKLGHKE